MGRRTDTALTAAAAEMLPGAAVYALGGQFWLDERLGREALGADRLAAAQGLAQRLNHMRSEPGCILRCEAGEYSYAHLGAQRLARCVVCWNFMLAASLPIRVVPENRREKLTP